MCIILNHSHKFNSIDLSLANTNKMNTNTNNTTQKNQQFPEPEGVASSSSSSPPNVGAENWGTHIMGTPAVPSSHPDNKKAALQSGGGGQPQPVQYYQQHPFVQHSPVEKPSNSPMESILHMFDSWSKKAEATAHNVWHNREFFHSISFYPN